jgi:hypothetical protein
VRLWLDRYLEPDAIRLDGAFHRYATRRARDGAACIVIVAAPHVDASKAHAALTALSHAHRAFSHPNVPRAEPVCTEGDVTFVELACDGTIDGIELLSRIIATRSRIPFEEIEALTALLVDAAKGALTPLGRLTLGSLLVSPQGRIWLVGFGHSVAVEDERGSIATAHAVFQASDVALGAGPSRAGDLAAIWQLRASLLPHTDVPSALVRVLRGEGGDANEVLGSCVRALEERSVWNNPEEAEAHIRQMHACLALEKDAEGLTHTLSNLVLGLSGEAQWTSAIDEPTEESIALGHDAAWIDNGTSERVKLGASLRKILQLLLQCHDQDPQRSVATWELLDAGWPGETMAPEAGANRVYAAISRLRNMGLRGAIERHDDGYRIAPRARITRIPE